MTPEDISLFSLESGKAFAKKVAGHLGLPLGAHEERDFEDGEHKCRPLENVRGQDVFVVQSLYGEPRLSVNDKLCRLLFFLGALKDASARRVTAVVPYLCYARKDRKTKSRDPVTTRYVAGLLEAVGTDRVVTLDVHNLQAFQNAFRIRTDHLEAKKLFVKHFAPLIGANEVIVLSPDAGGMKRAEAFRESLGRALNREIPVGFMQKQRSMGAVSGETVVADVAGRMVIIIDDLISTGTTLSRAAAACKELGASSVSAAATHGVFVSDATKNLAHPALENIVITDSIPPLRLEKSPVMEKLLVLEAAPLLGQAIERIHSGGSLVELLGD